MDTLDDSYMMDSASTISFNTSAFNSPAPSTRAASPSNSTMSLPGLDQAAGEDVSVETQDLALPASDCLQTSTTGDYATSRPILAADNDSATAGDVQDPFLQHPHTRPTPRRVSPPVTRPCTPSIDSPAPSSPHLAFPSFPPSPLPHPGRRKRSSTDGSSSVGTSEEHEGHSSAAEDEEEDRGLGLRMPSMSLGRARMASARSAVAAEGDVARTQSCPPVRILLLGKTSQDRLTLARLLLADDGPSSHSLGHQGEGEISSMSASFLSTASGARSSDRSRSRSSSGRNLSAEAGMEVQEEEEKDGTWETLGRGAGVSLVQPSAEDNLRRALRTPLEKLEAMLNSSYPASTGMMQLALDGADRCSTDACIMLMSSPPTPAEVSQARSISHLLPLYPVLVLPPAPSSSSKKCKPQKTTALVEAVSIQLTKAGVRWLTAPTSSLTSTPTPTIHLLPHELFLPPLPPAPQPTVERDHDDESGPPSAAIPSSLTSSQELLPPSPTFTSSASSAYSSSNSSSSRSRSPRPASSTHSARDLARLRTLIGVGPNGGSARENLRRERGLSFLEWREVEIAARRSSNRGRAERWDVSDLPSEWSEGSLKREEARQGSLKSREEQLEKELEFSRRVAERRRELRPARGRPRFEREEAEQGDDEASKLSDTLSVPLARPPPQLGSSLFTDASTPRCPPSNSTLQQRFPFPLAPFAPSTTGDSLSSSMHSAHSASYTATSDPLPAFPSPSIASSASASSSLILTQSATTLDPFHLPSLLHLVGLNIRMSLMPHSSDQSTSATEVGEEKQRSSSSEGRSWIGTAALLGVVFLAGALAGVGVVSGVDGKLSPGWWRAGLGLGLGGVRLLK